MIQKRDNGHLSIVFAGHVRNIYFLFDIEADTSLSVAMEMVAELAILDYDVTRIADMIDREVASLVLERKPGPRLEGTPGVPAATFCQNCASNVLSCGSLLDSLSLRNPCCSNMKSVHCCQLEGAEMPGQCEELMYPVEGSELRMTGRPPMLSTGRGLITPTMNVND